MSKGNQTVNIDKTVAKETFKAIIDTNALQDRMEFVPQKIRDKDSLRESVRKAQTDNAVIGMALKDKKEYKIEDVSQVAKLESIRGRNLAHILLNNKRYRKDSDEMNDVKTALSELETALQNQLEFKNTDGMFDTKKKENERIALSRTAYENAGMLFSVQELYQTAIAKCRKYLSIKAKNGVSSEKGIERYDLVKDTMTNMIDELNHLNVAKQLVCRGIIGNEPMNVKELIIRKKEYTAQNPTISKEVKDRYDHPASSFSKTFKGGQDKFDTKDKKFSKDDLLLIKTFTRQTLPSELVENYSNKEKDRKKAASFIGSIWKALLKFEPGKMQSVTINVGENTFSLFQKEDGKLDLIFTQSGLNYNKDVTDQSIVQNLGIPAADLAARLAKNMVESEQYFGKELTADIFKIVKDYNEKNSFGENSMSMEISKALLINRLGMANLNFSNIPADKIIEKAKELQSGKITEKQATEWVKEYEYGDKAAKKKTRDKEIKDLELIKKELDEGARKEGFKDYRDYLDNVYKNQDLDELAKELTEQENEALMKNALKPIINEIPEKSYAQKRAELKMSPEYSAKLDKQGEFLWNNYKNAFAKLEEDRELEKAKYIEESEKITKPLKEKLAGYESEYKSLSEQIEELTDESFEALNKIHKDNVKLDEEKLNELVKKTEEEYGARIADIEKKMSEASKNAGSVRSQIAAADSLLNIQIVEGEADYAVRVDDLEKERDIEFELWDRFVLRGEPGEGDINYTFEEWKLTLKREAKEKAKREEEKEQKKKADAEEFESRRDVLLDIEELKEKDLSTLTDEKINSRATLDLLKHREKLEKSGKLKELIVFSKDEDVKRKAVKDAEREKELNDNKAQVETAETKLKNFLNEEATLKEKQDALDKQKAVVEETENELNFLRQEIENFNQAIAEIEGMDAYAENNKKFKNFEERYKSYLDEYAREYDLLEETKEKIELQEKEGKITPEDAEKAREEAVKRFTDDRRITEESFKAWSEKDRGKAEIESLKTKLEEVKERERIVSAQFTEESDRLKEYNEAALIKSKKDLEDKKSVAEEDRRFYEKKVAEIEKAIRLEKEAEVEKERLAKEKEEEKQARIEAGLEWTEEEEKMRNLLADIVCPTQTWTMDNETTPGERIWKMVQTNKDLIKGFIYNPESVEPLVKGITSKMPLELFGIEAEDIDEIIKQVVTFIQEFGKEVKKGVEEHTAEFEKREKARKKKDEINKKYGKGKSKISAFFGAFGFGDDEEEEEKEVSEEDQEILDDIEEILEEGDPMYVADKAFSLIKPEDRVDSALNMMFAMNINSPELQEKVGDLVNMESKLEKMLHNKLRGFQRTMQKTVEKNFGGEGEEEEEFKKIPYYRQSGITKAQREKRIDQGNEELEKMIESALKGKQGQGQYFRNIMSSYVAKSSGMDLRMMIASAIRNAKAVKLPKDPGSEEKNEALCSYLGGFLKGAGPLLQKTLQGMPENMVPRGFEEAFRDMKDNLAPIQQEIVEAELLAMIERSNGFITKIELGRSLGAASVGQAFLCRVYTTENPLGEEVVIKLLRPDVRNRMLREEKIMRDCAKKAGPGMLRTFDGQMVRIREELDLTIEAKNCEKGAFYDEGNVSSMKISRIAEPTPNSLMAKKADGDTVTTVLKKLRETKDSLLKSYYTYDEKNNLVMDGEVPKLNIPAGDEKISEARSVLSNKLKVLQDQQKLLIQMAEKWVQEAVFGNGYYHGDLHSGNIMLSDNHLTIIDFGNVTQLNESQQVNLTKMLLSSAAGKGEDFMESYIALLSDESKKLLKTKGDELKEICKEVMQLGDAKSAAARIGAALIRAQKLGFELPASVYGFQQCQMRVQNTIDDFNKEIVELQSALEKLEEADKKSEFDLRYEFIELGDNPRQNMRLELLPDNFEEFRELLRGETQESRDEFFTLIGKQPKFFFDFVETRDEKNIIKTFGEYSEGVATYKNFFLSNFFTEEEYMATIETLYEPEKVVEKKDVNDDDDDDDDDDIEIPERKVYADKFREFIESLDDMDLYGQAKRLFAQQDEKKAGRAHEDLDKLEEAVFKAYLKMKDKMKQMHKPGSDSHVEEKRKKLEDDWNKKSAEDKAKKENIKKHEEDLKKQERIEKRFAGAYSIDVMKENLKPKFMDPELKEQAENELKKYFKDNKYGAAFEKAFNDFYKALESNSPDTGALLDKMLEAMRMPVLRSLAKAEKEEKDRKLVDTDKPYNFLMVMADVIGEEWKKALKRVNIFKTLQYALNINYDLTGRGLTFKEIKELLFS